MTIAISSPVQLPAAGINRIRVARLPTENDEGYLVVLRAFNAATQRGIEARLMVRNGPCDVLRVNPSPAAFDDALEVARAAVTVATGADQLEAAIRSGANRAGQARAIETALLAIGAIDAALAGAVS